MMMRVSEE